MSDPSDEHPEHGGQERPLEHEEARELLDEWRDGELDAAQAARVAAHVETCEKCRRVDEALGGGLKQAIAGAPQSSSELLPGVQRRIRLRSRGRFYPQEARRPTPSPWPLVVVSLAVLAALMVSYFLLGQVGTPSVAPSTSTPATHGS